MSEIASMVVQSIRSAFPNPMSAKSEPEPKDYFSAYCVGGAFCRFVFPCDHPPRFPDYYYLGSRLSVYTKKNIHDCVEAAKNITSRNDEGDFEAAWQELERIITPEVTNAR